LPAVNNSAEGNDWIRIGDTQASRERTGSIVALSPLYHCWGRM